MKFEEALQVLKQGKEVRRKGWDNNSARIYVSKDEKLSLIDNNPYDTEPEDYVLLKEDMLADDWGEYKEPLLTEEEKEYLKMIIKFHPREIDKIQIYRNMDGVAIYLIYAMYADKYSVSLDYFKNLEEDKGYTLKELGLDEA